MKRRIIIALIVAACFVTTSHAQDKLKLQLGYNVSIPQGSFKSDYIDKTSFKGATGEIAYDVSPNFTLGLSSGYQNYYQRYDRAVYKTSASESISAVVTNSVEIVPLLLKGTYFPLGSSNTARVQPYVSAGAGFNMVNDSQYLGEFGGMESSSPFAAQAGAGIRIPFGKRTNGTSFTLGGTYNYVNYDKNGVSKLNNIGVNAGVVFPVK